MLPDPAYDLIEQALIAWADGREDVRAAILIGSRARAVQPPDAWSDLDCMLLVDDSAPYCRPGAWRESLFAAFGRLVWSDSLEFVDDDTPDWELVLEGGLKVDLVFSRNRAADGRTAPLAAIRAACPLNFVFAPGARVLVDHTPSGEFGPAGPTGPAFPLPERTPTHPPDQAAYHNRVANSLNELVRAAKLTGRGELWRAAKAMNEELRLGLLALIEWHAGTHWEYGRFLETWADPRVVAALPDTYSDGTVAGTRRAILHALALLEWLAPETAARLGLAYPREMVEQVGTWLRQSAGADESAP